MSIHLIACLCVAVSGATESYAQALSPSITARENQMGPSSAVADENRLQELRETEKELGALLEGRIADDRLPSALAGSSLGSLTAVNAALESLRSQEPRLKQLLRDLDKKLTTTPEQDELHAKMVEPIHRARQIATLELSILQKRLDYLNAVEHLFSRFQDVARRSFLDLNAPREARRQRLNDATKSHSAVKALRERVLYVRQLAQAGRLVGFSVDLGQVIALARDLENKLEDQQSQLRAVLDVLSHAIEDQEARARVIWRRVLASVLDPNRQAIWDSDFTEHVQRHRALRLRARNRRASFPDLKVISSRLEGALPSPQKIGSTSQATTQLEGLLLLHANIDEALSDLGALSTAWEMAFEKELVTIFSDLASEETRVTAFRLSTELLRDLWAEGALVFRALVEWGQEKRKLLQGVFQAGRMGSAWREIARWSLGLLLVAIGLTYRSRSVKLVSLTVARLAKVEFFRGRVGALVRWGSLGHALAPTVVVLLGLFFAMLVVGRDHSEIQLLWVFVWWFGGYALLGCLIAGLTTPVSRARPAFLQIKPENNKLLDKTYKRFGFFLTSAIVVDEITSRFMGVGPLQTLIDYAVLVWMMGWALWSLLQWRLPIAGAWLEFSVQSPRELAIAGWMQEHRLGAILSPVALVRMGSARVVAHVRDILQKGGVIAYLRAQFLKRIAQRTADASPSETKALPGCYIDEFPLYPVLGEDDSILLPREEQVGEVMDQLKRWKETRTDGSLVLLGGKGMGKTTFLSMLHRKVTDIEVVHHSWSKKTLTETEVVEEISESLGVAGDSIGALCDALNAGPRRVVLLDEAHDVFLRTVYGYKGFDALVRLVNGTSDKIFWVLVFNEYAWQFINESRRRARYFRKLMKLPDWSSSDLQDLIARRNRRSGYTVEFDAAIADRGASDEIRLIEGGDSYFRLLADASGGNPRVATYLWLQSLELIGEKKLLVRLVREPKLTTDGLTDEMLFVMAAVCQHENLSAEHLEITLRLRPGSALFAMQFLREKGIFEPKERNKERMTLSPKFYRPTLRVLRNKHLLFEAS